MSAGVHSTTCCAYIQKVYPEGGPAGVWLAILVNKRMSTNTAATAAIFFMAIARHRYSQAQRNKQPSPPALAHTRKKRLPLLVSRSKCLEWLHGRSRGQVRNKVPQSTAAAF